MSIKFLARILIFPFVAFGFTHPTLAKTPRIHFKETLHEVNESAESLAKIGIITTKFLADPLLNPFDIKVKMEEGEITLRGKLDTDLQFERAVQLALEAPGVDEVDAQKLKVKTSTVPAEDLYITASIKASFAKNKLLTSKGEPLDLDIQTKEGVVYITGNVASYETKAKVLELAKANPSVKQLKANIHVKTMAS